MSPAAEAPSGQARAVTYRILVTTAVGTRSIPGWIVRAERQDVWSIQPACGSTAASLLNRDGPLPQGP